MRPFEGIRVIDVTHVLAGPFAAYQLAVLGADVIKVDDPNDPDQSRSSGTDKELNDAQMGTGFLTQASNKRAITLDLKTERDREILKKLVATADVFVENYRPGALTRLGLGYAELSKLNPRLIYCSVSAYGHTGPDSAKAGFGLIAEAKSGAMAQVGNPGEAPPLLRIPIADMYTGVHGVAAICAALVGRASSGKGQHIDLALYDCMVSIHDYAIQRYTFSGGTDLPRQTGAGQPDSPIYGVFSGRDGYLVIAAQVDDAWRRLAKLIGGDALAADARFTTPAGRAANYAEATRIVDEWTRERTVQACLAALDAAEVPCSAVQTIDQVLADPQIQARNMVIEQEHPVLGKVKLPNLPFRFSDCDTTPKIPAPLLGQHNEAIAASLGYSEADIAAMTKDGVLYSEKAAR